LLLAAAKKQWPVYGKGAAHVVFWLQKEEECPMLFCEKLQSLRKCRGLTQEALADVLCISRQAVAKWEAGQAYPDITNLICLSEVFLVTVDYLVKEDPCQIQPLSAAVPEDALAKFLVKAKCATYAGKGPESASSRPASHDLQYREGDFLYIDTYLGGERFSGEEAVWKGDVPVYAMNYSGRVIGEGFSGDFLKAALCRVPVEKPFRGPEVFEQGDALYRCTLNGTMDWFQGYEEICNSGTRVYECYFHGGAVK
jgi:transcriptional regulator with XRE-family HTH domain